MGNVWNGMRQQLGASYRTLKPVYMLGCLAAALINWLIILLLETATALPPMTQGLIVFQMLAALCSLLLPVTVPYLKSAFKATSRRALVVLALCSFYMAFATYGNPLFLIDSENPFFLQSSARTPMSFFSMFYFLLAVLLFVPIVLTFASLAVYLLSFTRAKREASKNSKIILFCACMALFIVVESNYLYAFNPAITSSDTQNQLLQAMGIISYSSWQAPFHTFLLQLLITILPSLSFVAMVQMLFFATVWSLAMVFLYELGLRPIFCLMATFVILMIPPTPLYLITIWKDIPYTASVFWIVLLLAKLICLPEKYLQRVSTHVQLGVALLFICLLRTNGFVVFVLCSVVFLVVTRLNKKILASIACSVAGALLFMGPANAALGVQKLHEGGEYLALMQDIYAVYVSGGTVPESAQPIIDAYETEQYIGDVHYGYEFSPYRVKSFTSAVILDMKMGDFLNTYIKTFFSHPIVMIRSVLCRIDLAWNLWLPAPQIENMGAFPMTLQYTDYYLGQGGEQDLQPYYGARVDNMMTESLFAYTRGVTMEYWMCLLLSRSSVYVLAALLVAAVLIIRKQVRYLWILSVGVIQIFTLMLSAGWLDYRYYWPLGFIALFFILLCIVKAPLASKARDAGQENLAEEGLIRKKR